MGKKIIILVLSCIGSVSTLQCMQSLVTAAKKSARTLLTKGKRTYSTHRKPGYGFLWTGSQNILWAAATIPNQHYAEDSFEYLLDKKYQGAIGTMHSAKDLLKKEISFTPDVLWNYHMSYKKCALINWVLISTDSEKGSMHVRRAMNDTQHTLEVDGVVTYVNPMNPWDNTTVNLDQVITDWPVFNLGIVHKNYVYAMSGGADSSSIDNYNRYYITKAAANVSYLDYSKFVRSLGDTNTPENAFRTRTMVQGLMMSNLLPNMAHYRLKKVLELTHSKRTSK